MDRNTNNDEILSPEKLKLLYLLLQEQGEEVPPSLPFMTRKRSDEIVPLSFGQERLWFFEQVSPGNPFLNIVIPLHLKGEIQAWALERSFNILIGRHEILQTVFSMHAGKPFQSLFPSLNVDFSVINLSNAIDDIDRNNLVHRLVVEEGRQPFHLSQGPLLRIKLFSLLPERYVLVLTMHHIISDGWSLEILWNEIDSIYSSLITGRSWQLPALPVQYADFTLWQRQYLDDTQLQNQIAYWTKQLADLPARLELPTDYPRPLLQTFRGAAMRYQLPNALIADLKKLGQQQDMTLFMILLAGFQILLARYAGSTDIVVGVPVAHRNHSAFEKLIGFFVNTLVIRTDLSGDPDFREVLQRVRHTALEAYAHQDLPFEKLVEVLSPKRNMGYHPLFQVTIQLISKPIYPSKIDNIEVNFLPIDRCATHFDISVDIYEMSTYTELWVEYGTNLFKPQMIKQMLSHYLRVLERMSCDIEQSCFDYSLMNEEEARAQLFACNAVHKENQLLCINQLFEQRVELNLDTIAVVFEQEQITYSQLNGRTNQLAKYLRDLGVGPEISVGICIRRSVEMLVGLLGILKAGGTFVPLDPSYPQARLDFILQDACAPILITQSAYPSIFPSYTGKIINLDTVWIDLTQKTQDNLSFTISPHSLAYIMYTSGTTGNGPKGVMITHEGLSNYLSWAIEAYTSKSGVGSAVHSSLSFDLTVTSLFLPLLAGHSVFMVEETVGIEGLAQVIQQYGHLGLLSLTPAHLLLLEVILKSEDFASLEATLVIGGEALTPNILENWRHRAPQARYFNEYGPTETVVGCCVYEIPPDLEHPDQIPIGHPIQNTQLYVLDAHLHLVPVGVIGELYIAGTGVARGYLNQPEITAERFIPNPFSPEPGKRMYRSGDRAKYRDDGVLEYIGRVDDQVKLRGFRIEPAEIAAKLNRHPLVQESLVRLQEDPGIGKRLVAYVLIIHQEDKNNLDRAKTQRILREFLGEFFPKYMIPSAFVILDKWPLTTGGKVDLHTLPAPVALSSVHEELFAPPRTPLEQEIAALWMRLLNLENVSIHDNFFDLGGHSLLLIQVLNELQRIFNKEFSIIDMFKHTTISSQAKYITQGSTQLPAFQQRYERAEMRREALERLRSLRQSKE